MSQTSFIKYCRLAFFSGPACERVLYRQMAKWKPTRILEIGLGMGVRSLRMFEVARRYCESSEISYTGIDPFESRSESSCAMSMKDAYKLLRQNGVRVQLVPGDTLGAMTRTANSLANTDLIVIDASISDDALEQAWKYFPRMMHDRTLVFRQTRQGDTLSLERMFSPQVQQRVDQAAANDIYRAA